MTYVKIPYTDLYELIVYFQKNDFSNELHHPYSNFVIVSRPCFMGSYGGIYHSNELKTFKRPFIYDYINPSFILVWWKTQCSDYGDLSLTKNQFALVTPKMYKQMTKAITYKPVKSSYY